MSTFATNAAELVDESVVRELAEECKEFSGVCPEAEAWCADNYRLRRFIVGHNGSVANSKKTLKWCVDRRCELSTWRIEPKEVEQELRLGKFYVRSVDKQGHPIIIQRARRADWRVPETMRLRTLIMVLDELERRLDRGDYNKDGRWIMLLDQGGKTDDDSKFSLSFQKDVIMTLLRNYPERMIKCCVVDTSWFVNMIWAAIKPVLDERTKQKIVFCKRVDDGFGNKICPDLLKICEPVQVEREYGGLDEFQWNADVHWDITRLPHIGSNQPPKPTVSWWTNTSKEALNNAITYPAPDLLKPKEPEEFHSDRGEGTGWATPPLAPEHFPLDSTGAIHIEIPSDNHHRPMDSTGYQMNGFKASATPSDSNMTLMNKFHEQLRSGNIPADELQRLRRELDGHLGLRSPTPTFGAPPPGQAAGVPQQQPQSLQLAKPEDPLRPKGIFVSYREIFLATLSMGLGFALAVTVITKDSCA